ncbi:MAG: polysaccharide biosynthesis tyrosine autokinase [Planctomycetes bacterium]|nr:polysaccharide biosynthesis tyrosine autokinase [Planctomycetota bacterium]
MTHDTTLPEESNAGQATAHVVHTLYKFLRVVRYRKGTVLAVMGIFLVIGTVYFCAATRYYASSAQLLVVDTSTNSGMNGGRADEAVKRSMMATFVNLLVSQRVVDDAIEHLDKKYLKDDLQDVPRGKWVETLQKNLSASSIRGTNILEVRYRSRHPEAAAAIVAAIVDSYLEFMNETHSNAASRAVQVLHVERVKLQKSLAVAIGQHIELSRQTNSMGLDDKTSEVHPAVRRVLILNEEFITLTTKRLKVASALAGLHDAIDHGEDIHQHVIGVEKAVGQQMMMAFVGVGSGDALFSAQVQTDLLKDRARLKSKLKVLGSKHPVVDELQESIAGKEKFLLTYHDKARRELRQMADQELGPLLIRMLQQQLANVGDHERRVQIDFRRAQDFAVTLTGNLFQLKNIDNNIDFYHNSLDELIKQLARISEQEGIGGITTARTQYPKVDINPVWPKLPFIVVASLFAGLVVGCGIVYVTDVLDDRFRSPEEMQDQLRVPVLAIVRRLESVATSGLDALQVHSAPNAAESEAFRTLRTTLAFSSQETSRMVISSAEPGDGKTTVVANLAVTYAQSGKKVLLIDADLRRPGLTKLLGLRGTTGLSSLLRSEEAVASMAAASICASGLDGLDVLASGPRPTNPAELLNGARFSELLAWAETIYDQILIDSPPALAASDSAVIGRIVDGVLLVVQPEKNQRRSVVRAADSFMSLGIDLIGVIINRASDEKDSDFYGYGGYGYGNGGYGYGGEEDEVDEADEDQILDESTRDAA